MKRLIVLLSISFLASSFVMAQMPLEEELYASVLGIEGRTHAERGAFIKDQLHTMGVGFVTAPFKTNPRFKSDTSIISGENIIARIGTGAKRMVVGAHYDAFKDSPGANDNGSGVAVVLALIRHLRKMEWNYSIDFCFFDQEEAGLTGSMYYIKQFVIPKKHLAMINLDIEGSGNEVYVGPVGKMNRIMIRYVREAAQKNGVSLVESENYPGSDNLSFSYFRLENISISVVPKGDGDRLSRFVQNGDKADSLEQPKVLDVIHTMDDRSNLVSPGSLKISYEFTKTLLLLLNESRR
ncbi:MAG: Zn-dependent exopeptidase M28 [Ignavibacteriae bacterium]|nr:MAG: Zn-dependent exopeptidase M28 [Ignavibacteriota bacterium]